MADPPVHGGVDNLPEENDVAEDRTLGVFTVLSDGIGSILFLIPAGVGVLFGGYGFLRQCYQYIQQGQWTPYSVNDLLGWHTPQDWFAVWEVMDTLHPMMLIVVALALGSAWEYLSEYVSDVLTTLPLLFTSHRDRVEADKRELRLILLGLLFPPAVVVLCAGILYIFLNGAAEGSDRGRVWVYILSVGGILGLIRWGIQFIGRGVGVEEVDEANQ